MTLNDPETVVSEARTPAVRMVIAGVEVPGVIEATVATTGYANADTLHARLSLDAMGSSYGAAWWGSQASIIVEFDATLTPGAGWTPLITAQVDRVSIDLLQAVVEIDGRDLSALLREAPTSETFPNQSSSQIATVLAARHGLAASVTATTQLVGQYYELEHSIQTYTNGHQARTEWELLAYLARIEGADLWVSGYTLNYQPSTPPTPDQCYAVAWTAPASPGLSPACNVGGLMLSREQTLARNITVKVITWSPKQRKSFQAVANGAKTNNASVPPQTYVFMRPNMSPDQAAVFAKQMLSTISRQERKVEFWMPGELALSCRNGVILTGTGTSFDQQYFIGEIERNISIETGFRQRMVCLNQSPATVSELSEAA